MSSCMASESAVSSPDLGRVQAHNEGMEQRQSRKMTAIVVPAVIAGFVAAIALGCLALGLAKKGATVKA